MIEKRLDTLVARTAKLHDAVHAHVGTLVPVPDTRYVVAFQADLLSLAHAAGSFALINQGHLPSAYALLRPQYECLVRGVWLLHAASDTWVERLAEPLTLESARRANEGPMLAEMLKQLEGSRSSPGPIVQQLNQYRDATWQALNSYAHGGLHPLSRTLEGYPTQLTYDAVRNSNAVLALAAQLASVLSGDLRNMELVRRLHIEFADCLPILNRASVETREP